MNIHKTTDGLGDELLFSQPTEASLALVWSIIGCSGSVDWHF